MERQRFTRDQVCSLMKEAGFQMFRGKWSCWMKQVDNVVYNAFFIGPNENYLIGIVYKVPHAIRAIPLPVDPKRPVYHNEQELKATLKLIPNEKEHSTVNK